MGQFQLYDRVKLTTSVKGIPVGSHGVVLAFHELRGGGTYTVAFGRHWRADIDAGGHEPDDTVVVPPSG